MEPLGYIPPKEAEENYYANLNKNKTSAQIEDSPCYRYLIYKFQNKGLCYGLVFHEARHRIEEDDTLSKIDKLLDWSMFFPILQRGLKLTTLGRWGYDPLQLFKCLLVGQWHGLSDPKLEKALKVRIDFMLFCGFSLSDSVPDETTHCRFRNALVKGNVFDDLLTEVNRQIEDHGLKVKEGQAAIIDATLIESAARPNSYIDSKDIAKDRSEVATTDNPAMTYSADPDARWVKKGRKSMLGYKSFARWTRKDLSIKPTRRLRIKAKALNLRL